MNSGKNLTTKGAQPALDFLLCRRLVDDHQGDYVKSRQWAIDVHECFLEIWNALGGDQQMKEISVNIEEAEPSRKIHLSLKKKDGTRTRINQLNSSVSATIVPICKKIENLMQLQPDELEFPGSFKNRLSLSLNIVEECTWRWDRQEIWWHGVFRHDTTVSKMENMLGSAYEHWVALQSRAQIEKSTCQPLTAQPASCRRI